MPSSKTVWKLEVLSPRPARQEPPGPSAAARRCRSSPAISPRRRESTGRHLLPEAGNFVVDGPVGGGLVYGSAKFIGKCESEAHLVLDCASKKGFRKLSTVT